jgi:hypothetical protein
MSSTSGVPAGWYPDPANPGGQRFWDGNAWTHDVSGPAEPAPAAPAAPVEPAPAADPAAYAPALRRTSPPAAAFDPLPPSLPQPTRRPTHLPPALRQ